MSKCFFCGDSKGEKPVACFACAQTVLPKMMAESFVASGSGIRNGRQYERAAFLWMRAADAFTEAVNELVVNLPRTECGDSSGN